jgi:L-asparaginase
MEKPRKPRVAVIGTGGTISSVGRHSLDVWEYMAHGRKMEAVELVKRFPELEEHADVVPVRFRAISSSAVSPKDWLELNTTVHAVVEEHQHPEVARLGRSGHPHRAEEVHAGVGAEPARRPLRAHHHHRDRDPERQVQEVRRLLERGRAVRDHHAVERRLAFDDEIQAAREVTKASTLRLETFRSPDVGMLGYADPDGRVVIYRSPTRRRAPHTEFDVRGLADLPRVDIAYSYAGADGTAIGAFVTAGARAIVSASLAPGMTTPAETEALLEARRRGVLVVIASRAGSGRVLPRSVLRERGFVVADNLNPQKARVLVMLALTVTTDVARMQRMFGEYWEDEDRLGPVLPDDGPRAPELPEVVLARILPRAYRSAGAKRLPNRSIIDPLCQMTAEEIQFADDEIAPALFGDRPEGARARALRRLGRVPRRRRLQPADRRDAGHPPHTGQAEGHRDRRFREPQPSVCGARRRARRRGASTARAWTRSIVPCSTARRCANAV